MGYVHTICAAVCAIFIAIPPYDATTIVVFVFGFLGNAAGVSAHLQRPKR